MLFKPITNNFPLTGGDMATRGEAVSKDLKWLTNEIESCHGTFGNFFQTASVNSEKTLAGRNNTTLVLNQG
jgi:hypothetical protein